MKSPDEVEFDVAVVEPLARKVIEVSVSPAVGCQIISSTVASELLITFKEMYCPEQSVETPVMVTPVTEVVPPVAIEYVKSTRELIRQSGVSTFPAPNSTPDTLI